VLQLFRNVIKWNMESNSKQSKNKIFQYLKQVEIRTALFSVPFLISLLFIILAYAKGLWLWIGVSIIVVVSVMLIVVGLKFAKTDLGLRLKEKETETIIALTSVGIVAYDTDFKISIFNHSAEEIFGISSNIVLNKIISTDMGSDDRYRILVQTIFTSLAPKIIELSDAEKYPHIVQISFNKPELHLRVITDRIYDEDGNVKGFIKIVINKTIEQSIIKSKNEFIEVTAHQLRTPLTAISWSLEILTKSKNIVEEDLKNATMALEASQKMLRIVNDLLDVSRIEDDSLGYDFKKTDLEQFLKENFLQIMPIAKKYGIKLYFKRPRNQINVVIDSKKMSMAIMNIIDNAIKYNVKNGSVTISAQMSDDKNFALVSINDTGVGIPREEQDGIFKKFHRGERSAQLMPDGTGLGLYIAKNVINKHGGKIWLESEVNRGTTFYVTIPVNELGMSKKIFGE